MMVKTTDPDMQITFKKTEATGQVTLKDQGTVPFILEVEQY